MAASQPPASLAPAGHNGVIVVAEGTWPQHPWLGRLESGSDMGSDGAWFTTWEDAPAPIATLDALTVEHTCGQGLWQPAARADWELLPIPSLGVSSGRLVRPPHMGRSRDRSVLDPGPDPECLGPDSDQAPSTDSHRRLLHRLANPDVAVPMPVGGHQ